MKLKLNATYFSRLPRSRTLAALTFVSFTLICSNGLSAQPAKLQQCQEKVGRVKTVGDRLLLTVPKGAKLKRRSDVDYSDYSVKFSAGTNEYFLFGIYGPTATSGNVPGHLAEKGSFEEKQWTFNDPLADGGVRGVDARGRHRNGNYWRYLGTGGESVTYSDIPEEAAVFFDNILNAVCYNPWKLNRSGE